MFCWGHYNCIQEHYLDSYFVLAISAEERKRGHRGDKQETKQERCWNHVIHNICVSNLEAPLSFHIHFRHFFPTLSIITCITLSHLILLAIVQKVLRLLWNGSWAIWEMQARCIFPSLPLLELQLNPVHTIGNFLLFFFGCLVSTVDFFDIQDVVYPFWMISVSYFPGYLDFGDPFVVPGSSAAKPSSSESFSEESLSMLTSMGFSQEQAIFAMKQTVWCSNYWSSFC